MPAANGAEHAPNAPSTSNNKNVLTEEKLQKLLKRREVLIKAKEKFENREVDFDHPEREELKDKKEKNILKTLLELEKKLYEQGYLEDVNEDTKRLFDDNGQKDELVIEGTGHPLLDQRLTEALKKRLQEDEPSFVISCALFPQDLFNLCAKVRQEELDTKGKSYIPMERTTSFDVLLAKMADLIKKAVIKHRYGDHSTLLNLFLTEQEAEELNDVQEATQPADLPADLTQMAYKEDEDNEHIPVDEDSSGSNEGDSTDYDEVFEAEEDPQEEEATQDSQEYDEMDQDEATSEPRDNIIENETTGIEGNIANDILPQLPSSLVSEHGSSIQIQSAHNQKAACNYSEIVLSSGPASPHSTNEINTCAAQTVPIKSVSMESPPPDVALEHNGRNDSQQKVDETGDEEDETAEELEPLKPDWLKGKTAAELVECFNARLKADDLQVIYATEYEEIEPRIEKHKMERCENWAGQIENWVAEFPEAAEVETLEAQQEESSPNSTSSTINTASTRKRERTRPRSERLLIKERGEAEREIKRMKPVEFVATSEIITID